MAQPYAGAEALKPALRACHVQRAGAALLAASLVMPAQAQLQLQPRPQPQTPPETATEPAQPAPPSTAVRVGDHPGFGRVVFDLPDGARYELVTEADRTLIVFRGAGMVESPDRVPKNLRTMQTGMNSATLRVAPGARVRPMRMSGRLVVDIYGPGARTNVPATAQAAAFPVPAPAPAVTTATSEAAPATVDAASLAASRPEPTEAPPAPVKENRPASLPATPPGFTSPDGSAVAAPTVAVAQEPLAPPSLAAATLPPVDPAPAPAVSETPSPGLAFTIPTAADVGAAAFRRGPNALIVLDRRIVEAPLPEGAGWAEGAVSTTIELPLPQEQNLRLEHGPNGWLVTLAPSSATAGIMAVASDDGLGLPMPRPGRAVAVLDPVTGGTLLVGTSIGAAPPSALLQGRRTPDYRLLPTWLGVAVEATADRVDLRANSKGFTVFGAPAPVVMAGTELTRRFDFPGLPTAALLNRLNASLAGAASAAPRAKTRDRLAAIQAMIALGMGPEAHSLTQMVAADDPQAAADAEVSGLAAIAAVLSGRDQETAGLDDSRLDGTDEVQLWRGIRDRFAGRQTETARNLGNLMSLAQSYPSTLRRAIWPTIAEAAVEAGLAVPADQLTPYAAAVALEKAGEVEQAINAYTAVVAGSDHLAEVRAAARLTELKLAAGRIGPAEAAVEMERQSFAWRGDDREIATLLRAAELRGAAADWRPALDALDTLQARYPGSHAAVQAKKAAILQAMLATQGDGLSALQLVLLAADHADAVSEGPSGAALARLLADKLTALDLPARAIPILKGLMQAAPAGEARAEFGAKLAALLLEGNDAAGAITALAASDAEELPAGLLQTRGLAMARARAAQGDVAAATAGLYALGTIAADDLRAAILANAGDFRGSLAALRDLAQKAVPADGPLTEQAQEVLLRQASAAAQLADTSLLRALERSTARMTGPRADLFRVLTAPALSGARDLPRAARELTAARALPRDLNAIPAR